MSKLSGRPMPLDDEVSKLRVPPHSLEAEQSVLGGLLLDNAAWDRVGDLLVESDFYRYEHKLIYAAVCGLIACSRPADVITVYGALQANGKADEVGGMPYLNALSQSVPTAANVRRYAEIVRERALLRNMIAVGDEMATRGFNPGGATAMELLDAAAAKVYSLSESGAVGQAGPIHIQDLVVQVLDRVQDMADKGGAEVTGVPTGFTELDKVLCGLQGGDLVVLAARPSMGKTSFALNIAEHVAVKEQLPVVVFSMEMGAAQLALKMVGSLGKIQQQHLRKGTLNDFEWGDLTRTVDKLRLTSIFIDESPALGAGEIRARARRLARQCGKLGLIVIDYLQLMAGVGGEENRATELGAITRALKGLAKELDCPVVALSQLNRTVEQRTDKRPMMSDLRESGAIEQDADIIMFIYRDDYYNKQSQVPGVAEINVAKNRNGPTDTIQLVWLKAMTKFENMAAGYKPGPKAAPAGPEVEM